MQTNQDHIEQAAFAAMTALADFHLAIGCEGSIDMKVRSDGSITLSVHCETGEAFEAAFAMFGCKASDIRVLNFPKEERYLQTEDNHCLTANVTFGDFNGSEVSVDVFSQRIPGLMVS